MKKMRIVSWTLTLCCMTTLVGCGPNPQPYVGEWPLLNDYGPVQVRQEGKVLMFDPSIKAFVDQTLMGEFREDQLRVEVPVMGSTPVDLTADQQHLRWMDRQFTRDFQEATESHLAMARQYAEQKIQAADPLIKDPLFKLSPECANNNGLGRVPVVACQMTADPETCNVVVNIQLPDVTPLGVKSQDLAAPDDFTAIEGVWRTYPDGRTLHLSAANRHGVIGSIQGEVKLTNHSTDTCKSCLKEIQRNGFLFNVKQIGAGVRDCGGTGEEHFVLLEHDGSQLEYTVTGSWNETGGFFFHSFNMHFNSTDETPEAVPENAGL